MSAKKSRPNQSKSSPQTRSKKLSCCTCCFGGNASESSSEIYLDRGIEATDLLVEKMVVQRVPVRLFATEEDYRKIEAERSERQSQLSTRPFANYHSTLPKADIKTASTTKPRPIEQSSVTLHYVDVEVLEEKLPFRERINVDSERELTDAVLNNLSYLHSKLDSRRISKNSSSANPPRKLVNGAVTNMPSQWRYFRNNTDEVKTTAPTLQVNGRDMTPEMKDTLLMLGSAKKPGNYRFQKHFSHRKKNKKVTNESSFPIEATNAASYHDYDVLPKAPNLPGGTWQKSDPYDKNFPTLNNDLFHDSHTIASVKKKLLDGSTHPDKCSKKYGCRSRPPEEEQRIVKPIFVETSRGKTTPRKKYSSEEESVERPQITEIKKIKGSYLKWRIIIRHRNKSDE